MKIKILGWISNKEAEEYKFEEAFGGMGGFFKDGMRMKDYKKEWKKETHPYIDILAKEIVKRNIRLGGDWHQNDDFGVPLFNDYTIASFSFRAWGDLLAAIWSEKENKDYSYMDFYCYCKAKEPNMKGCQDGLEELFKEEFLKRRIIGRGW